MPQYGGKDCPGSDEDTVECMLKNCASKCKAEVRYNTLSVGYSRDNKKKVGAIAQRSSTLAKHCTGSDERLWTKISVLCLLVFVRYNNLKA